MGSERAYLESKEVKKRMKRALLIFAIMAMVPAGAFAALTLPFTDNFNAGGPDNSWETYNAGVYSAALSGVHIITGYNGADCFDCNDGGGWQFCYPADDEGTQAASVIVEAVQYINTDAAGWRRTAVGCRVNGTGWANARDSGYWVSGDTDADDYFQVTTGAQNWSGLPHARLYGPATCSRDVWHHWAIAVDGNVVKGYSDTEGPYGEVYSGDISTLDITQQWANGYVGIAAGTFGAAPDTTYTDSITIDTWSPVDNWTLY